MIDPHVLMTVLTILVLLVLLIWCLHNFKRDVERSLDQAIERLRADIREVGQSGVASTCR